MPISGSLSKGGDEIKAHGDGDLAAVRASSEFALWALTYPDSASLRGLPASLSPVVSDLGCFRAVLHSLKRFRPVPFAFGHRLRNHGGRPESETENQPESNPWVDLRLRPTEPFRSPTGADQNC